MRSRLSALGCSLAFMLSHVGRVASKQVFAHYMVGTVTEEHVQQDINDAIAAGITGFALNIGDPSESFVSDTLQYMFNYAPTVGFYLHISMDIWASGDADGGHPELYNDILQGYVAKSGYYQATAGMPFITTFSDGGLTADEWDAWKLSALANKLYFCPDFDGTAGYNTSATEWWDYWGDTVDCVFSWDASWEARPGYSGSEGPGSIEIDEVVIAGAKARGKNYMMGLSALQYKNAYSTNIYRPGEMTLINRMVNILGMSTQPDYIVVITWNDGPESHYVGNIWPEQNTDADPARYVNSDAEWSHAGWQPLIHSFSDAYFAGGSVSSMTTPLGYDGTALGAIWYKSVLQTSTCSSGDHPDGWTLGKDQINWAIVIKTGTDTSNYVLRIFNGASTTEKTGLTTGLNYGSVTVVAGTPYAELYDGDTLVYIASGGRAVSSGCPDGIFNMNDIVVGLAAAPVIGCSSLQQDVLDALSNLMSNTVGYWENRDCERTGICGHFPEPGTSSPGLSAQEWTNVNSFETIYNAMWQTANTDDDDLIEIQDIVPNIDHGSANLLPVTESYTSQDDAGWAGVMYLKVQQYNDAHGLQSGSSYYYDKAVAIQKGMADTWLSGIACGGGVPQLTSGGSPNTITTHLFFWLSVNLALYSDPDGSLRTWADTVGAWYTTGKGTSLRDTDGLYFDGQGADCASPDNHKYTYNQGPILSALGAMATLTGDQSYITFALTTLDGVVKAGSSTGLPQTDSSGSAFLELPNGILAEWCDGTASSPDCDHDKQYFKGAFMKHLQYFLDNVNVSIQAKYASFVGAQASGVIHYGTNSDGLIGSVWYGADEGGSIYNYKTHTAGLDALNCAQKYAQC